MTRRKSYYAMFEKKHLFNSINVVRVLSMRITCLLHAFFLVFMYREDGRSDNKIDKIVSQPKPLSVYIAEQT